MKEYIITVDIGTGCTKAVIFDDRMGVAAQAQVSYRKPCITEMSPDTLFNTFVDCIRRAVAQGKTSDGKITALGIAASPYAFVAVDRQGNPLSPLSSWGDKKILTKYEAKPILGKSRELYRATGCPFSPNFPASRLLWMRGRDSRTYLEAYKFISLKSFLLHKMTGKFYEDHATASGMGLMDLREKTWNIDMLRILEINEGRFGRIVSPYEVLGEMPQDLARKCGLKGSVAVVACGSDIAMTGIGSSHMPTDELCINIGFTASLQAVSKIMPSMDPEERLWYNLLDENKYLWGGTANSGSGAIRWLVQNLFPTGLEAQVLEQEMIKRMNRPNNSLCFPFFWGERTPFWNPSLSATFTGLNFDTSPFDMLYTLIEGISFNICNIYNITKEQSGSFPRVRITGGGVQWKFFSQFLADLFNRTIEVADFKQGTSIGTALTVRKGIGASVNSYDAIKTANYKIVEPQPTHVNFIAEKYAYWQKCLANQIEVHRKNEIQSKDTLDFYRQTTPPKAPVKQIIAEEEAPIRSTLMAYMENRLSATPFNQTPEIDDISEENKKLTPLSVYKLANVSPEQQQYMEQQMQFGISHAGQAPPQQMPGMSQMPQQQQPSPQMPGMPQMPQQQSPPQMPGMPQMPQQQAPPQMPGMPQMPQQQPPPQMPGMPQMPQQQAPPQMPGMPQMPQQQAPPQMPGMPQIPQQQTPPQMPGIPRPQIPGMPQPQAPSAPPQMPQAPPPMPGMPQPPAAPAPPQIPGIPKPPAPPVPAPPAMPPPAPAIPAPPQMPGVPPPPSMPGVPPPPAMPGVPPPPAIPGVPPPPPPPQNY